MFSVYNELLKKKSKLMIIGAGYVGMDLALAFNKKNIDVIVLDNNISKIEKLSSKYKEIDFTCDNKRICESSFIIVALPTPVDNNNIPDIQSIISVTNSIEKYMKPQTIIVYESTVYPGLTEEICIPILEKKGLKCGIDFLVGYSPERVNPGDNVNNLSTVTKIISCVDQNYIDEIEYVYKIVVNNTYRASSIKVAESSKIIENIQRDVNIALMNELSILFDKMQIPFGEVLNAAKTKWNFLDFYPGLVGGHCISVDPYYLINKAMEYNNKLSLISSARKVNENMVTEIANKIKKENAKKILIFGATFKANVDDIRNSKILSIAKKISKKSNIEIYDPFVDKELIEKENNVVVIDKLNTRKIYDLIIYAVDHDAYNNKQVINYINNCNNIIDLTGKYCYLKNKTKYWSLR